MFKTLMVTTAVVFALTATLSAAVVKDQKCTHKDGSAYDCSTAMLHKNEHMKECGVEWKAAKSDAAVKSAGWPAFWHTCSVKLKASDTATK